MFILENNNIRVSSGTSYRPSDRFLAPDIGANYRFLHVEFSLGPNKKSFFYSHNIHDTIKPVDLSCHFRHYFSLQGSY